MGEARVVQSFSILRWRLKKRLREAEGAKEEGGGGGGKQEEGPPWVTHSQQQSEWPEFQTGLPSGKQRTPFWRPCTYVGIYRSVDELNEGTATKLCLFFEALISWNLFPDKTWQLWIFWLEFLVSHDDWSFLPTLLWEPSQLRKRGRRRRGRRRRRRSAKESFGSSLLLACRIGCAWETAPSRTNPSRKEEEEKKLWF